MAPICMFILLLIICSFQYQQQKNTHTDNSFYLFIFYFALAKNKSSDSKHIWSVIWRICDMLQALLRVHIYKHWLTPYIHPQMPNHDTEYSEKKKNICRQYAALRAEHTHKHSLTCISIFSTAPHRTAMSNTFTHVHTDTYRPTAPWRHIKTWLFSIRQHAHSRIQRTQAIIFYSSFSNSLRPPCWIQFRFDSSPCKWKRTKRSQCEWKITTNSQKKY